MSILILMKHVTVFVLAFGIIGSLGAWPGDSAGPDSANRPAEVVLIGTLHWQHLYSPDYTFAHLRALLEKIVPDVLGIEKRTDWQSPEELTRVFPSEDAVTLTYAREHGIPVFGVDWLPYIKADEPCFWPTEALDPANVHVRAKPQLQNIRSAISYYSRLHFDEEPTDLDFIHARVEQEVPEWWEFDPAREDSIVENIIELAARFPGKRAVVMLGALHLFTQAPRLRQRPEIRLIDARDFLPLTGAEVKAAWKAEDMYPLLGTTLDSWIVHGFSQAFDHRRTKKLLTMLLQTDSSSASSRYYLAKSHFLFGRYDEAAGLLDSIIAEDTNEAFPFFQAIADWSWPPWSRVRDKAVFTRAIIHDLEFEHEQAAALYQLLMSELSEEQLAPRWRMSPRSYFDLHGYLGSLIQEPYKGGPWEAFRIRDARRCWP